MALVLTSGPAVEPVSLAEAKAHLRVDGSAEDTLIASLIVTSRLHVEAALGLALITQSWSWYLDAWPAGPPSGCPCAPSRASPPSALRADGAVETLEPGPLPPRRRRLPAAPRPPGALAWPRARIANGIEIAFTAGYGNAAADVPGPHPPGRPPARRPLVRAPLAAREGRPRRAPARTWCRSCWRPTGRMRYDTRWQMA